MTHTPGPYTIHDTDDTETVELWDKFGAFASCEKRQAALLSAAPALYEALKLCERALECRDTEAEEHAAKEARRVLRLAEGGKP